MVSPVTHTTRSLFYCSIVSLTALCLCPQNNLVTDEVLSKVMIETHSATMLANVLHEEYNSTIPTLPIPGLTNFITPQYNIHR